MPGVVSASDNTARSVESTKPNGTIEGAPRDGGIKKEGKVDDNTAASSGRSRNVALPNGIQTNGVSPRPEDVKHQSPVGLDGTVDWPPPDIPHYTAGYVSLSTLIIRLAQETFNEMNAVIDEMAELSVQQSPPNGILNHVNHQVNGNASANTEVNVQKKLRLLNFTSLWRPKFIKALVLLGWARRAEEVSKVIDLKLYFDTQEEEYVNAVREMGQLSRLLALIKEPSPDIKTALHVLLLRQAPWLPDLSYLPPDPLSSQELLDGLRRINTLLSIRLNLHETIPSVFRDFSIASGRVTFTVKDEFEVDLSILDEEPSSQFFFIDFRFAFTPGAPGLPPGRLQLDLQDRADVVLRREGLQGLYDLLHNFVLTHKLTILRSQALEMSRGYWSEHLVVEPVRRAVVVQYWSNRAGGKNWIEIGVKRGPEKRSAYSGTSQRFSEIALRHFRAGKEVKGFKVDLHLAHLSMEKILNQVIARHTSDTFQAVTAKVQENTLYSSASLKIRNVVSSTEPTAAAITVQVTATRVLKILQEPITGRLAVQPSSSLNSRLEYELNRLVTIATDASPQILHLRAIAIQEEVEEAAASIGWQPLRSFNPGRDAMRQHFPKGIQQYRFYRHPLWDRSWILAFIASAVGDSWWVTELVQEKSASETATSALPVGMSIKAVYRLPSLNTASLAFGASPASLTQVEQAAAGMICQHNDTRYLANARIPHKIHISSTGTPSFSIFLRYPTSKAPALVRSPRRLAVPWANEVIRLDYRGLNAKRTSALHVASARLNEPNARLKDLVSSISSLAINTMTNSCAFRLVSKVGESCIPDLTRRLASTERLLKFALVINDSKLRFTSASLSHLEFIYARHPTLLKATLHFSLDSPLRLSLPPSNPHLRVLDFLNHRLKKESLKTLIATFRLTLPLLTALARIEMVYKTGDYEILARSEQWYEIRYSKPSPMSGFEIRLRTRREEPMWFIPESSIRKGVVGNSDEEWNKTLKAVMRGRGNGWHGMHGGIAATLTGISETVERLDEAFRSAPPFEEGSQPTEAPPAPVAETVAPAFSSTSVAAPGPANNSRKAQQSATKSKSPKRKAQSQIVEID